MTEKNLIQKAAQFSKDKHKGERQKFNQEPFYIHCYKVATFLLGFCPEDENLICAGYLHDTLQANTTTCEEILENFNKDIADLVSEVTNNPIEIRNLGKATHQMEAISRMSSRAHLLKLCDIYSNVCELFVSPEHYADVYYVEKKKVMEKAERDNDDGKYQSQRELMHQRIIGILKLYEEWRTEGTIG